jgi:hypothetical protein
MDRGEIAGARLFAEVKSSFAESLVCDRIACAKWVGRNRTADLASRERGRKTCLLGFVGHFLRCGLRAGTARFRAIFSGMQPGFSATQTEWRRREGFEPWVQVLARTTV